MRQCVESKTIFNYNSDLSGDVILINKDTKAEFVVPGKDILDFVANYVRDKKIATIEDMNTEEILFGK